MRVGLAQDAAFTAEGIATFTSATDVVTAKWDGIGCTRDGPRVPHKETADIISDGIPYGAIQVAGDGLPIILLADRGTTGGYAKLATMIEQTCRGLRRPFQATASRSARCRSTKRTVPSGTRRRHWIGCHDHCRSCSLHGGSRGHS